MKPNCFEEYPNQKFKLISVNDIDCNYPHRYKVIFQNTDSLEKYEELLLPEELRGYYIVGNIYSFDGLEYENSYKRDRLYVPKSKVNKTHAFRIKDCIHFNDDYGLEEEDDFYNQYCFIYETKNYIYLIPHYVVANRYYFVSTSIKKALSEGSFHSLYYEEDKYKFIDKTLYITTKKTLKDSQVPLVARMITNDISKRNFMFFYQQTTKNKLQQKSITNVYMPLMMGFPFEDDESFTLKCQILDLGNIYSFNKFKTFDLRKVMMITHIIGDKIPYNFEKIHQDVYIENIIEEKEKLNTEEMKNIPRNNPRVTGHITKQAPSEKYLKSHESFKVQNEYDFSDINIEKEEVVQDSVRSIYEITDEVVDESFDRSKNGSNSNRIREKLLDDDITKDSFKIEDFYILFENFIAVNNINESLISELIFLENYDESVINKFYIDNKKKNPRSLIYGYFIYNGLIINFIEMEHNIYWDKNTWYFVSNTKFVEAEVQIILNNYILQNQSAKQMVKELKPIGVKTFFMTRHEGIDINAEMSIANWCNNLKSGIKRHCKY